MSEPASALDRSSGESGSVASDGAAPRQSASTTKADYIPPITPGRDEGDYLSKLMEREYARMRKEAERWGEPERGPLDNGMPVGLALSGGGIRSATYCLGVLECLAQHGWLNEVDYLSTVSGGGYIGGSLSWFLGQHEPGRGPRYSTHANNFPFETEFGLGHRDDEGDAEPDGGAATVGDDETDETPVAADPERVRNLRWLRQHGDYLTPGGGLNTAALVGVAVRSIVPSVAVYLGFLTAVFLLLRLVGRVLSSSMPATVQANPALWLAGAIGVLMMVSAFVYSVRAWWKNRPERLTDVGDTDYRFRRAWEVGAGWVVVAIVALAVVGSFELVHGLLEGRPFLPAPTVGSASLVGGLLVGLRYFQRTANALTDAKARVPLGFLLTVGSVLVAYGVLLLAYEASQLDRAPWNVILVVAAFAFGWMSDVNLMSFHRFYRDRLMETFMPNAQPSERGRGIASEAEAAPMSKHGGRRPYHLVNTNLVLVRALHPRFRGRGGDSFILSSEYCGSSATGWMSTTDYMDGSLSLATAVAVSGAAANPNAGVGGEGPARSPFAAFLMSFLNIRLGAWLPHPNPANAPSASTPNFLSPGLNSLARLGGYDEASRWIELTDGGHFENLGLYELIRRRCRLIIVCDAAADPNFKFADLGNAVERVRADFGVLVLLDGKRLDKLDPNASKASAGGGSRYADLPFLIARIVYPVGDRRATADGPTGGVLIYLKSTMHDRFTNADVYAYKAAHPHFPDQTTADQFFDERQFEAYRELGFLTTTELVHEMNRVSGTERLASSRGERGDKPRWFTADDELSLAREAINILKTNARARRREVSA